MGISRFYAQVYVEAANRDFYPDGFYFRNGGSSDWFSERRNPITTEILSRCGFTNVQNFVATSPTASNFTRAAFYGITFRGTYDGEIRDYSIGLRGASNSVAEFISTSVSTGPTEEETVAAVTDFAQTRINNLIALQPDLASIAGGGDGGANLTVSSMGGQVDLSTAPDKNVWARLKGNWSNVEGSKSDYILGLVGTHTTLASGVIIGAMAQIDRMESKEGDATLTGTGFLVGPYVVAKPPDLPITMQGRLLYGKSSNEYSPLGTFVDRFDSTRLMAQLGVSGQIINGTTVWKPNLQAAFASEQTDAYTDGAGTDIASTKTAVGQVAAGLDVTFALPVPTGGLTATFGLTNIWTNGLNGGSATFEGNRAKISAGINREFAAGTSLSLTASYDGLGANSYESIGLDLLFQHRF